MHECPRNAEPSIPPVPSRWDDGGRSQALNQGVHAGQDSDGADWRREVLGRGGLGN